MALFKVLKGQEANLPTEKKEGWAYVTYAETTIPAGQQYGEGSMYVDVSDNNRIKINMHADMASMDDQHQSIAGTYIKDVTLENGASAPYYKLKYGNNTVSDATHAPLPIASATNAGIITADKINTQILTGPKKFDANGSLEISRGSGFLYSGIETGNSNTACCVWFAHSNNKGKPVINTNFVYNPASTDPWNGYGSEVTGTATTAHGVLTAERLQGIAYQAFLDTSNVKITSYLHDMKLVNHATQPYYTITRGDNTTFNVNLPVAGLTYAGIITTGLQILAGEKHFEDGAHVYTKFNYADIKDIKDSTGSVNNLIWLSAPSENGVPVYSSKFTFNQNCADKWSEYSSDDTYSVINVDRVNGLARYAVADSSKNNITSYYIHKIDKTPTINAGSQLLYNYTMGNNIVGGTISIPAATLSTPGIVSFGTQYFRGQKIFVSEEDILLWGENFDEIMLMEYGAYYTGQGDLPSGEISIFSDRHNPLQLTSTTHSGLIINNKPSNLPPIVTDNSVLVDNLNVDLLDGFHASNATFEWSTADNASEQVLPTRSAICRSLNNLLQASQALYYKGTIDPTNSSSIPSAAKVGDVYIFSKAGTCFGQNVEAGDMAICSAVNGNTITWNIVQMNIDGAVRSSTSSTTDGELVLFDGTSGKVVKNSGIVTTTINGYITIYENSSKLNLGLYTPQLRRPLNIVHATNIIGGTYTGGASLSGTPTAPTAAEGTNTTQIATTAFVTSAISKLNTSVADNYVLKSGDEMTGELIAPRITVYSDQYISRMPSSWPVISCKRSTSDTEVWYIDSDGFFSGWVNNAANANNATNATKLYVNNDTTSKLYVLGATSTGNQNVYRESNVYMQSNVLYGAAWNDYAEFRQGDTLEPGKCVVEAGDDTLTLATDRMTPGASIVSDTFGFSIGETEKCKTPIAVSGRVLAYPYESREEFRKNIGRPVCSGPNGTVSIMTDEEYKEKGYCALGTISAVPDYEEWGTGNVKVNNRVWIHVK